MTAFALLFATVLPTWAATAGPTKLADPTVTPRSATTEQTVVFTVSFRNREGSAADWVRVKVGSTVHSMTSKGGSDWKRGITFRWSGRLPVGTHAITFSASSRDHFSDAIAGGSVQITNPPPDPPPKPTPRPTPKPTPKPAVVPTTAPTTAPPAVATDSPSPTPTEEATPSPSPTPSPSASDDAVAVVPRPTGGPASAPGGGTDPAAPAGGPGAGPLDGIGAAADLLVNGKPTVPLGLVATLATTSTAVGATLAFGLFGKRRRARPRARRDG